MFIAFNSQAISDPYSFPELQYPVSQKITTQLAGSNCSLPLKGKFLLFYFDTIGVK